MQNWTPSLEDLCTARPIRGWLRWVILIFGASIALFHIYVLGVEPINPWYLRAVHVSMMCILILALLPISKGPLGVFLDISMAVFVAASAAYIIINLDQMMYRLVIAPSPWDLLFATGTLAVVLEVTRRSTGIALPLITAAFIIYALYGDYMPGLFWHQGLSFSRLIGMLFSDQGIYGLITGISSTYVILFIIFGAFIEISGVGQLFIDSAMSVAGRYRGGPAKMAVAASMLFAGISGSAIANVVSTGTFTIPLMKAIGFAPAVAGAIEAAASTAGNLTPPIMGPSAFIMAEILGIPYAIILVKAFIPAALYFICIFIMVDLEAAKLQLKGLPADQLPSFRTAILARGHLLTPVLVMLYILFVEQASPIRAALWGIAAAIVASWMRRATRVDGRQIVQALYLGSQRTMSVAAACITAGIIVAIISSTGLGTRIGISLLGLANDSMLLSLIATMVICLILGMGLPTVAAYVVAQSVMAPALIQIGIDPLAAHLFIFYFAIISAITPPVALAAFAAAGIAGSNPFRTAWHAARLGCAAFIVPYMFAYGPALLLDGSIGAVAWACVTAIFGIYLLAIAVQGYMVMPITIIERLLLVGSALVLIKPGLETDLIGAVTAAIILALHIRHRGNTAASQQDQKR
ncbi:TRAP transporter fused permease subunit [Alcaligenaceae bacterium CGII-47]|nr:TRAP transporter fused permease subunit [Alcaligenaceae bacterium CGII-47]